MVDYGVGGVAAERRASQASNRECMSAWDLRGILGGLFGVWDNYFPLFWIHICGTTNRWDLTTE